MNGYEKLSVISRYMDERRWATRWDDDGVLTIGMISIEKKVYVSGEHFKGNIRSLTLRRFSHRVKNKKRRRDLGATTFKLL